MICRRVSLKVSVLLTVGFILIIPMQAQNTSTNAPQNLLLNPDADEQSDHWFNLGNATIENAAGHETCFSLRNHGSFYQDIPVPPESERKYAVLLGLASSERINQDGAITGLPSLSGLMMSGPTHSIAYPQGQQMLGSVRVPDAWGPVYGIFVVPPKTAIIRFSLNQAERNGVPQNGSAARFDNLGLYILPTWPEAMRFIENHFNLKEKLAPQDLGQAVQFDPEHWLDRDRYKAKMLGHMDEAQTIQVYAMAKVSKSEEAEVRSIPHQEAIAYGRPGDPLWVIRKFEGVLWVSMTKCKFIGEDLFLYFAVMHPQRNLQYFKYNPNTKGPLQEIDGEGYGNDAKAIIALKAMAQIPPRD